MSADRKAVFQHFMKCYHNSFSGGLAEDGRLQHSPKFVLNLLEAGDPALAAGAMRLDPRLTTTEAGACAFAIAKAIAEDKGLAPFFLDIELAESVLMVTFEHKAEANRISRTLAEVGKVGVLARPGEQLSDHVVSDLFLIAVEPAGNVRESVVKEMKARFVESAYTGGDTMGDKPADDEQKKAKLKDGDKKAKDGDKDEDDVNKDGALDQAKDSLECSVKSEASALGLDERIFGDEALARFEAKPDAVASLFTRLLGEAALLQATHHEFPSVDHEKPEHSKVVMAKGAKVRIRKHGHLHHMHSAELGHENHLMASAPSKAALVKHAEKHGLHVVEAEDKGLDWKVILAEASLACRNRLIRVLGANGLLEGGIARPLPEAFAKAVDAAVSKVNEAGFSGDPVNEVALAIDAVAESAEAIFGLFVGRVVDTHLVPMDDARKAKLVERAAMAGAADERAALAAALTAVAKLALRERGVDTEADKAMIEAWKSHVSEATKPAPEPVDPASDVIDSLILTTNA